jgi:hypothetical protein
MKVRLLAIISVSVLLTACLASNLAKFETDLEGRVVSHASIAELPYEQAVMGKRLKYKVASPLPVIDTPQGKAFAVPLHMPDEAKGLYFRSVLSSASALTAHIAYPTFIFLSEGMLELGRVEPDLTARNDMSFDAAYFDGLVQIPDGSSNVVTLFSPEHFGKKFRYEANIFVGAVSGGMVIGGDKQIDEGIPVGPGGPFRMEFRAEIE